MLTAEEKLAIESNVHFIQDRISELAVSCGRAPDSVRLVAVTKTQGWDRVETAVGAGAFILGENRLQEAIEKIPEGFSAINPEVELHFIGHLQSNKVKKAVGLFSCIESVDRVETLALIQKEASRISKRMRVLFEVNTSGEASKQGVHGLDNLLHLLESAMGMDAIEPIGLMTIGPLGNDEQRIRQAFASLADFHDRCRTQFAPPAWTELSMGMSGDYPWAIAEGATLVRIGTALFGPRLYPATRSVQ